MSEHGGPAKFTTEKKRTRSQYRGVPVSTFTLSPIPRRTVSGTDDGAKFTLEVLEVRILADSMADFFVHTSSNGLAGLRLSARLQYLDAHCHVHVCVDSEVADLLARR